VYGLVTSSMCYMLANALNLPDGIRNAHKQQKNSSSSRMTKLFPHMRVYK
jgi:hypothetical protein